MNLQAIDESNRSAHYYLTPEDECYFLHEFSARKGFNYSPGNQFIYNLKKSPLTRNEPQYQYKKQAIANAIAWLRGIFGEVDGVYDSCTFVPIPPSKLQTDPAYDDRMWQVVTGLCQGTPADAREMITQSDSYEAAHLVGEGGNRIKPGQLEALYRLDGVAPRPTVLLFDDVLSAGCHFVAAKRKILAQYPQTRIIGFFLARRVLPDVNGFLGAIE